MISNDAPAQSRMTTLESNPEDIATSGTTNTTTTAAASKQVDVGSKTSRTELTKVDKEPLANPATPVEDNPDNLDDILDLHQKDHDTKSSSTEGPDSQAHSPSSSPIAMMVPAYPDVVSDPNADEGGPLLPLFALKFSDEINKDGDVVRYKFKVQKLTPNKPDDPELPEALVIEREYDDFEFLHHNLVTHNKITGLIVPPLPPRPGADPQSAESKSKKQFGSGTKSMSGDDFRQDVAGLERYMAQMLRHPVFGRDRHIAEFLEHRNAPIRAKIKKGFFAGMKESLETRKTSGVRDADDFFQKEREWAVAYGAHIKDACDRFNGVIFAQMRLANQVTHLATLLNASVGGHDGTNAYYNRLNSRFSGCLEDTERRGLDSVVINEESTLGSYLKLWSAYLESENAMLHRRTCLVIEADAAAKAMLKAKPVKAQAARRLKEDKDAELDEVSKSAELETRRFHQARLTEMKDSLINYTEGQIKAAKEAHTRLISALDKISSFPLPTVNTADAPEP